MRRAPASRAPWSSLGGDQVPVERLPAVADLDLRAGHERRRSVGPSPRSRRGPRRRRRRSSPARSRAAGRPSPPARTARGRCRRRRGRRPGRARWSGPCRTFLPPIVASRTASVTTTVWMPRPASVIWVDVGRARRGSGPWPAARRSPRPRCASGRPTTGRSLMSATWRAARTTLGLLGRSRTCAWPAPTGPPRAARRCSGWPTGRPARRRPRRSRGRSPPGRRRR